MMASKGDAGSPGAPSACCNFMVPILEEPGGRFWVYGCPHVHSDKCSAVPATTFANACDFITTAARNSTISAATYCTALFTSRSTYDKPTLIAHTCYRQLPK